MAITLSITIDCSAARAEARDRFGPQGANNAYVGVLIDVRGGNYTGPSGGLYDDPLRTVRLRGLTIEGGSPSYQSGKLYDRGIEILSAAVVYIEDCVISNVKQQGIYDHRTGGQTKLFVKDTIISGTGGPGILAASAATGITVLDNVSLLNNKYGLAAATGNNVFINRSVVSGNTTAGVEADPGAQVEVSNSAITHNNTGVQAFGTIRLRENDIKFSNTAVQGNAISMGANRFSGNGSVGATPPLASGASGDVYN